MRWGYKAPLVEPNHRLDPYRRGIARMYDGDRLVGHLTVNVTTWWMQSGHLWWRRHVDPQELPNWLIAFPEGHTPDWNDGIINAEDLDEELNDWDSNVWHIGPDQRYRLEWLAGAEREKAWEEYGWEQRA